MVDDEYHRHQDRIPGREPVLAGIGARHRAGREPGGVTLDVAKFTAGTHYPDGYLKSGTVLGKVTATGLYGPYDNAASDGREVARGHLLASLNVGTLTKIGGALLVHGFVTEAKLPTNHHDQNSPPIFPPAHTPEP